MRYSTSLAVAAGFALVAIAGSASAQNVSGPGLLGNKWIAIDGYKYGGGLPVGTDKNLDAVRVLIKTADALGQMRDNQYGGAQWLVLGDTTNAMRIVANGTLDGKKAKVTLDWDYRVPGVRMDVQGEDKSRTITVVAGDLVWDEKTPGVYGGAAKTARADRLVMSYLMPSAVVLSGRDAADKIKLGKDGARDTLTIPVPKLAADAVMVATLDAQSRPVHTQITMGGKVYTGDFDQFLNDRMDMEVRFPHQISLKIDGKPWADLELDWHQANPYLIFPVPKEVAAK
jgi:hypothetical protein